MDTIYIVVSGMFNEGYTIDDVFKSFEKAEKYVMETMNKDSHYERKDKYNWEYGCDFIEIKKFELQ
jgi:hypothetical protein